MKKVIRYLVIGLGAAIVFLVASVAIFVAVFDANAYKQDLSDLVREQTGRELPQAQEGRPARADFPPDVLVVTRGRHALQNGMTVRIEGAAAVK